MKSKTLLICLAASGIALFGPPVISRAQNRDSCSRIGRDQQDLEQAIARYGSYSSQAQHERSELRRDSANCGSYDSYGYNDRDTDGRRRDGDWRNDQNSDRDPYYGNYNGGYDDRGSYNTPAFDNGYRDGVSDGQRDRRQGKAYRPDHDDHYEDADRGYNKAYGDKNFYKSQYRQAYQRGYADGYRP
jgi:hypothetical protein